MNGGPWAEGERRDWRSVRRGGLDLAPCGRHYARRFRTHPAPEQRASLTFAVLGHGNNEAMREYVEPLLRRAGFRVTFAGHEHNSQPARVDDLLHVISGAGANVTETPPEEFAAAGTEAWGRRRIACSSGSPATAWRSPGLSISTETASWSRRVRWTRATRRRYRHSPVVLVGSPGPVRASPSRSFVRKGLGTARAPISLWPGPSAWRCRWFCRSFWRPGIPLPRTARRVPGRPHPGRTDRRIRCR